MKTKACSRCKRTLPADTQHFNRSAKERSGLRSECRQCKSKGDKAWRQANLAKVRRKTREYQRTHPDGAKRAKKKFIAAHPMQFAAKEILHYAVRQGRIIKPDRCEKCGIQKSKSAIHGHHHDYGYPLDVTWLCALCHAAVHMAGGI